MKDLVILWEAPELLSKKASSIFQSIIKELGLEYSELKHVYAIQKPKESFDTVYTIKEIREHRPEMVKSIDRAAPRVIIALGTNALKSIFDTNSIAISNERGKVLKWGNIKIIPTYAPGYAIKKPDFAKWIYSDIKNGLEVIKGNNQEQDLELDYEEITEENSEAILEELTETGKVVIDVETTDLDMFSPKEELLMVGFSTRPGMGRVYFNDTPGMLEFTQKVLNKTNLAIGHNIKFDLKWLMTRGITYPKAIWDTLVAIHLLDENYPEKGLKALARTELGTFGQQISKYEKKIKEHWKNSTEPTKAQWLAYNCGDVDATYRLYDIFKKGLENQGLDSLMTHEMKVLKVLTYMELNGFHINKERVKDLEAEYTHLISTSEREIKKVFGDINVGSTQQLSEVLYNKLGLPVLETTPSGSPSCKEDTLVALISKKLYRENGERIVIPKEVKIAIESLLKLRNYSKLYNTYIKGLKENNLVKVDSKVHCNYKITGTVTGRLSCSDPNLQNIPREGNIKLMFASRFKDGVIVQGDYSQAELRLLAHHAKSQSLIDAFVSNRDIHKEVAAKVFKKKYDLVTEQERKYAKQVNFGIVYLISGAGLAEKLGVSEKQGYKLIDEWFLEFPEVQLWIKKMMLQVVTKGYTTNIFGRKRRFFCVSANTPQGREAQRQGVNAPIQGGAGDLTKYTMMKTFYKLRKGGYESLVIGNVHDAIMLDCPKDEAEAAAKILHDIAVNPPVPLLVPLKMDLKVGPSWGELKEYNLTKGEEND